MRNWMLSRILMILALALGLTTAAACTDDGVGNGGDVVGGSCRDTGDCAELCVQGGNYPDGTCTLACRDDGECPDGTYCVSDSGGVCLLACDFHRDCRAGYSCDGQNREGAAGDVFVCIND